MDSKWKQILKKEREQAYYTNIEEFIDREYTEFTTYPPKDLIFNALELTPFDSVKVVIVGQDPYFNPGEAHGLAFSVTKGTKVPPSLRNIFKELHEDLGIESGSGDLTSWAKEGVLLLNRVLTVRKGEPNSHRDIGWMKLTELLIKRISERETPVVFLLWGSEARKLKRIIDKRHLVLEAPHPSPLSAYRGFLGCKHFSKCNEFLIDRGLGGINWIS